MKIYQPPNSPKSFFTNGRVWIPNFPSELFKSLFQHYPAKTQSCATKASIDREEQNKNKSKPA